MTPAGIQKKAAAGYAAAAARLGLQTRHYRPTSATGPVVGTPIATLPAYFDAGKGLKYEAAAAWGHPLTYGVMDTSNVAAGDYLAIADLTMPNVSQDVYFVARWEPSKAPICVLTNAVLDVLQDDNPADDDSEGACPPEGNAAASDIVLATGWPASLLAKSRSEQPPARLATDLRAAFYEVLLPAIPGVPLPAGLRLRDAAANLYHVATSELTQYGYRLLVLIDTT